MSYEKFALLVVGVLLLGCGVVLVFLKRDGKGVISVLGMRMEMDQAGLVLSSMGLVALLVLYLVPPTPSPVPLPTPTPGPVDDCAARRQAKLSVLNAATDVSLRNLDAKIADQEAIKKDWSTRYPAADHSLDIHRWEDINVPNINRAQAQINALLAQKDNVAATAASDARRIADGC